MIGIFEVFKIPFMQKALLISLASSGILSFLGVYVVLRRIVFVSIALAQLASCGYAFGFFVGINPSYCSLFFTLIGILLFSLHQTYQIKRSVPEENVIGIVYALASSLGILFIAKTAQAESYVLDLLSGNILTVTDSQLYTALIIFFLSGVLHYLFYKQFIFISFDLEAATTAGLNIKVWNLIFYLILGIVISLSIRTSGVIFTFSYMVIPTTAALATAKKLKNVFFISTTIGVVASFLGLFISYFLDLPTGPTIITVLSILSATIWLIKILL